MKRLWVLLALCLVLSAFAVPGLAAPESYEIPKLDMTVTVPDADGLMIVGRDGEMNAAAREWVAGLGLEPEIYDEYMRQDSIYFSAIDESLKFEYIITATEDEESKYVYDLDTLTENQLNAVINELSGISGKEDLGQDALDDMAERGILAMDIDVSTMEKMNGVTYMTGTLEENINGNPMWQQICITVKNGRYLYFRLATYGGPATEAQIADFKEFVAGTEYTPVPSTGRTLAQDKKAGQSVYSTLFIVILAVIAAVVIVIVAVRKRAQKKEEAFLHTVRNMQPPAPPIPPAGGQAGNIPPLRPGQTEPLPPTQAGGETKPPEGGEGGPALK
ncbi:hypothetical protein [Christensenella intestinihominis]|uniref:hypothetical protein n=1 Tax=Christensenella intestinihominis TaxID=1851429 RepID=UPI000832BC2E|nr:hypothetical protein [Christensenella intestinihominis]